MKLAVKNKKVFPEKLTKLVCIVLITSIFGSALPLKTFAGEETAAVAASEIASEGDSPPVELRNITTMEQADNYGRWLIAKYKKMAEASGDASRKESKKIPVLHIGNDLPIELKWVLSYLSRAGYTPEIQILKNDAEMERELEKQKSAGVAALDLLSYRPEMQEEGGKELIDEAKKETKSLVERARFARDQVFGTAGGMTLWLGIKRSAEEKVREARTAAFQASLGATSVAFSIYLKSHEAHFARAAVAMAGWIALNMYFARNVGEVQGQGRIVYEKKPGKWVVEKAPQLSRVVGFMRSMITNYIVMVSAFGFEKLAEFGSVKVALANSAFTLFSRFWYDELMSKKQGTRLPDGTMVYKAGDFTPKQQNLYRNVFEFLNGLFKNLHLLGVPNAKVIFPISGTIGLLFTIRSKWTHHMNNLKKIPRFLRWIMDNFRGMEVPFDNYENCQTLLVFPSAKPKQGTESNQ